MTDLCAVCAKIDFVEASKRPKLAHDQNTRFGEQSPHEYHYQRRYKHHSNRKAFRQAAADGCLLCEVLLVKSGSQVKVEDVHDQLYLDVISWNDRAIWMRVFANSWDARPISFSIASDAGDKDFSGRQVPSKIEYSHCINTIKTWLHCCTKHRSCRPTQNETLPTRVIDVGPMDGSQPPRLHCGEDERGQWVTLSHRWNMEASLTTTTGNLSQYFQGIPWHCLPKIFQDAIVMTRNLGYKYLWIDSLCILQDSRVDWEQESGNMCNIYLLSALTLAAAHSDGAHKGLLADRNCEMLLNDERLRQPGSSLQKIKIGSLKLDDGTITSLWLQRFFDLEPYHHSRMGQNCLVSRGWVLQESLLSPRTVSWTVEQMIWQCCDVELHECSAEMRLESSAFFRLSKLFLGISDDARKATTWTGGFLKWIYDQWYSVQMEYCRRSLTNVEDVLPAISGIARRMEDVTEDTFLAGLWKRDLRFGLLWYVDPLPLWGSSANDVQRNHRVPSWSWASQRGHEIRYMIERDTGFEDDDFEFIEANVASDAVDMPGRTSSSTLTIGALVRSVLAESTTTNRLDWAPWKSFQAHLEKVEDDLLSSVMPMKKVESSFIEYHMDNSEVARTQASSDGDVPTPASLSYLIIGITVKSSPRERRAFGLVLQETEAGSYQRVGIWHSDPDWLNIEPGWTRKKLILI